MFKEIFKRQNIPIVLIAFSIALSPRFPVGDIGGGRVLELRIEDILIMILGLIWFGNVLLGRKIKFIKPPLSSFILLWVGIEIFSVLINWLAGNIEMLRGFFYLLKQVEYFFLYFYVFFHIANLKAAKFAINLWLFLGLVNSFWIIYQILANIKPGSDWGAYGPGAIGEGAPFTSGGFFLLVFIFLFNVYLYHYSVSDNSFVKKKFLAIASLLPAIGVISSGSRVSIAAIVIALFLTFVFYYLKSRKKISKIIQTVVFVMLIGTVFAFTFQKVPDANRIFNIQRIYWELGSTGERGSRFDIWQTQLGEAFKEEKFLLFGYGISKQLAGREESHSQYVRNIVETGLIGSIAFLLLIFSIIKTAFKNFLKEKESLVVGMSAGLLIATISMLFICFFTEPFIVIRVSETYWFFTALAMSVFYNHSNVNLKNKSIS